jgi:hypothetical protein
MEASTQNYSDRAPEEVISEYPRYPSPGQALRSPAVVRRTTIPTATPMRASAKRTKRDWLIIVMVIAIILIIIATIFTAAAIRMLYF